MEIFQIQDDALGNLLSHITTKYLSNFYSICIYWYSFDFEKILNTFLENFDHTLHSSNNTTFTTFQLNSLKSLENGTSYELIGSRIDSGCQAFIVSYCAARMFLHLYSETVPFCRQRFSKNHFVFVPTSNAKSDEVHNILKHSTVYDVPNILIIRTTETSNINSDAGLKETGRDSAKASIRFPTGQYSQYRDNRRISIEKGKVEHSFDLITSQFVGRFNNTSEILLDTFYGWNSTFKRNANLFPDKLSNLKQRVVRLAIFNYKPYSTWQEVPSGLGNANAMHSDEEKTLLIDGTESLLFLEFCSKRNCTLEISLDEAGEWGDVNENRTGNGVLGAVVERRADVAVSALYEWYHVYQYFGYSMPISRTGITCLAPKPRRLLGWKVPIQPFSVNLWLATFIFLLVAIFSLFIKDFVRLDTEPIKQDKLKNFIIVIGIFLIQPSPLRTKRTGEMIIFGCILLIGMLIGNAYNCGLASFMTVPQYETPIDTPHQLVEKGIHWGATQDAWIFSILLSTQPDTAALVKRFEPISSDQLRQKDKDGNFAFSIERLLYGHYAIGEYLSSHSLNHLQIMLTDIYYEYNVAMSYKTWFLYEKLDNFVLIVTESGIQEYWEIMSTYRHSDMDIQRRVRLSRNDMAIQESLQFVHVAGTFGIWAIGLCLAFLIFLIEYFVAKLTIAYLQLRNRCLERLIPFPFFN